MAQLGGGCFPRECHQAQGQQDRAWPLLAACTQMELTLAHCSPLHLPPGTMGTLSTPPPCASASPRVTHRKTVSSRSSAVTAHVVGSPPGILQALFLTLLQFLVLGSRGPRTCEQGPDLLSIDFQWPFIIRQWELASGVTGRGLRAEVRCHPGTPAGASLGSHHPFHLSPLFSVKSFCLVSSYLLLSLEPQSVMWGL